MNWFVLHIKNIKKKGCESDGDCAGEMICDTNDNICTLKTGVIPHGYMRDWTESNTFSFEIKTQTEQTKVLRALIRDGFGWIAHYDITVLCSFFFVFFFGFFGFSICFVLFGKAMFRGNQSRNVLCVVYVLCFFQ